jgi:endonuclease I
MRNEENEHGAVIPAAVRRLVLLLLALGLFAPSGLAAGFDTIAYYAPAWSRTGADLRQELHVVIRNHSRRSYQYLWTAFERTDHRGESRVWDIYSDAGEGRGGGHDFLFGIHRDTGRYGNHAEGECYNREHAFPMAWWGSGRDQQVDLYTDLFHIYPTDKYVNKRRDNHAFGVVKAPVEVFTNGSRLGPNTYPGSSGTAFEPIDAYKGDLARSLFYVAVRYHGLDTAWTPSAPPPMTDGAQPRPWALRMLLEWHDADPVSRKEIDRNDAIHLIQGNRNPFIDYPPFVDGVWRPERYEPPFFEAPAAPDVPEEIAAPEPPSPIETSAVPARNAPGYGPGS